MYKKLQAEFSTKVTLYTTFGSEIQEWEKPLLYKKMHMYIKYVWSRVITVDEKVR